MKRSLFSKMFNKVTLTAIFFALELVALILIVVFLDNIFWWVSLAFRIIALILAIFLINHKMDDSYKITWMFFLALAPVIGAFCYFMFANKKFTKRERKDINAVVDQLIAISKQANLVSNLEALKKENADAANICNYIREYSANDIYQHSKVSYYPWGEDGFPLMLEKLKSAEKFIFMEYFIINEGEMWNSILTILKQKAAAGVDVRLMYDDLGCSKLPAKYPNELAKFGIKAYRYQPLKPLLDIRMNNRDHRKILVIDGLVAFSGGINIADEYINKLVRFGKWKDNVIMIEGHAVAGFTTLFLANWSMRDVSERNAHFVKYVKPSLLDTNIKSDGFIAPYGCFPYTYESVGQNIYINMALKAKKYLYICTPYLVLNNEMENALALAAKNGVDVRIVIPGIPDKKAVYCVSKSYCTPLFEAGVKIYIYTPGFVHAKNFLVDDEMASVGTVNLDYRSLYLHMENGTFMYNTSCIKDIKEDFESMFKVSHEVTAAEVLKPKLRVRFMRAILRIFAPLM